MDGVCHGVVCDGHAADCLLDVDDFASGEQGGYVCRGCEGGLFDDLYLFVEGGVVEFDVEHEAVELCFREWVGAFLFDGVLSGEDEERGGEGIGGSVDGDGVFLHGFEECCLGFGWCSVDFVGEDDAGEEGPFDEVEGALLVEYFAAGDVGGHEVRGELDSFEGEVECFGEGVDDECFCKSRDTEEKGVAAGEDGDEEAVDGLLLTDDCFGDFLFEGVVFFDEEVDLFFV